MFATDLNVEAALKELFAYGRQYRYEVCDVTFRGVDLNLADSDHQNASRQIGGGGWLDGECVQHRTVSSSNEELFSCTCLFCGTCQAKLLHFNA